MVDLPTIALAVSVGFQSGLIVAWRYYKRQRDEQEATRRQHERERELLEAEIKHERRERRRVEDCARSNTRRRHARN